MIATLLLALNLLSCATANTLNTLRIPTQRKTLNVNTSAVLPHPINYNDDWAVLGYYFIELGIGTPPQLVQLGLDTGSSDMWVPLANVSHCLKSQCPAGTCKSSMVVHGLAYVLMRLSQLILPGLPPTAWLIVGLST